MSANTLYLRTPAKINLSLVALGKRADGYHELLTEMVMIDLYDDLLLERTLDPGIHLRLSGRTVDGDLSANLVVRALSLLWEASKKKGLNPSGGFAADLSKKIPVGAGLGGGSSNAAIALWGGNRLLGHPLSIDDLRDLGRSLGADVPFFLGSPRAMGVGRGDILIPLPPPEPVAILLWNPEIPLPTPAVYKALDPADLEYKGPVELTEKERSNRIGSLLKSGVLVNSLERPAIGLCPQIGKGIEFLEKIRPGNVRMTGSGPTVFARFSVREKAVEVSGEITTALGGWAGVFGVLSESPVPGI
ncbi:MAG: 4-(cytidine 5'-diphospho)-2-C-methyl-D-erythritol kinase [Nitrospirae bacterium]|nr:4-(cytidine 5'-diphospho)-2-C-methyl-D-erythritol kinase [Nitrospirota bacterium]MCL5286223.1 4-(cytidine 5'-diphospho)-2-C-methyl-D-erythritol kinase [Nitrospirota bacterium]